MLQWGEDWLRFHRLAQNKLDKAAAKNVTGDVSAGDGINVSFADMTMRFASNVSIASRLCNSSLGHEFLLLFGHFYFDEIGNHGHYDIMTSFLGPAACEAASACWPSADLH